LRGSTGGDWVIDVPCVPNVIPHRETLIKSMDFGLI
jgi:predicted RNase H-like HicB family nuclease